MLLDYGTVLPIAVVVIGLFVAAKLLFADRPDLKKVMCQLVPVVLCCCSISADKLDSVQYLKS
jgi:hypothetical protein